MCESLDCIILSLVPRPSAKIGDTARVLVRMRIFPQILGNLVISVK